MSDRLFGVEGIPEVPLFREPRGRKGAARGSSLDARFTNEYPPEWDRCPTCDGSGAPTSPGDEVWMPVTVSPKVTGKIVCTNCLGMGSLKARVRLEAGHRCVRCQHPFVPKDDAKMLGVERSGMHDCETCGGTGEVVIVMKGTSAGLSTAMLPEYKPKNEKCPDCKGTGRVWTPWSACDERCNHDMMTVRFVPMGSKNREWNYGSKLSGEQLAQIVGTVTRTATVEAEWRILTVHHLSGDKSDVRWGNLIALCQRCHLEIQAKVVLDRVYPHEHSEWFKPHAAWWYAVSYLGESLSREEVMERMDELLALERMS